LGCGGAGIDALVVHLYELPEEEHLLILGESKAPDPFRVAALNFYRWEWYRITPLELE